MRVIFAAVVLSIALCMGGCASIRSALLSSQEEDSNLRARPPHPGARVQDKVISRVEFEKRINLAGNANQIRLVEVFNKALEEGLFEYRFFDVTPESVYTLLGIKPLDVLVGCNGYVLAEPDLFWSYVLVMPNSQEIPYIEVRRNGRPIVYRYTFVD